MSFGLVAFVGAGHRGQADDGQDPVNAPHTAGPFDRAEKAMLVVVADAHAGEVGTHDPEQG